MDLLCLIGVLLFYVSTCKATYTFSNGMSFRIAAGSRTCFFERGAPGHVLEVEYRVLDGQHGDLDISFDITDPSGTKLLQDYKKSDNTVIINFDQEDGYEFCMDNTFSRMNSKLVYVYYFIEDLSNDVSTKGIAESEEAVIEEPDKLEEIMQWMGVDEEGKEYYVEVGQITKSLMFTLERVVRARQALSGVGATRARDSYVVFEDTFIVDVWSGFQIVFMIIVGTLQVYMIKSLFKNTTEKSKFAAGI